MDTRMKELVIEKMKELKAICEENSFPMISAVAFEQDNHTTYVKEILTPLQCKTKITTDCITPTLLLFDHKFKIVPVSEDN